MNLNLLVPKVAKLKIEWFHCTSYQKSSGSIEHLSKIEWFHANTINVGPGMLRGLISVDDMGAKHPRYLRFNAGASTIVSDYERLR